MSGAEREESAGANAPPRRDELVKEIGALLLSDPALAGERWDAIALVATFADGREDMHGYRYFDGSDFEAWIPQSFDPLDRLTELHGVMAAEEDAAWRQCLVHLLADGPTIDIAFEYERGDRWSPGQASLDMSGYAASLKP